MSQWNERIYNWSDTTATKLEALCCKPNIWNELVDKIEEDDNVTCVFADEIRFNRSCTDKQYEASKKRAIKLVSEYHKKYC